MGVIHSSPPSLKVTPSRSVQVVVDPTETEKQKLTTELDNLINIKRTEIVAPENGRIQPLNLCGIVGKSRNFEQRHHCYNAGCSSRQLLCVANRYDAGGPHMLYSRAQGEKLVPI